VLAVIAAGLGAGWGVLVPGLVRRYAVPWPAGEPRPAWRTACDCGARLPPWWGRRCSCCGRRLGPPAGPAVALAAAGCALVAAALGPRPELPAFLVLVAAGVPLAFVDRAVLRLPDPLLLAAFTVGVVLLAATGRPGPLARAVLAAAASGAGYAALALLPGSPLGYGDVKLGAVLGLYLGWLGWPAVVAGAVAVPVVNAPYVAFLLLTGRAGRTTPVPYGPAMLAAALAAIALQTWCVTPHR